MKSPPKEIAMTAVKSVRSTVFNILKNRESMLVTDSVKRIKDWVDSNSGRRKR